MKKIVVFVVVYLLSAFAMYKWVHIAHSKGGRCETMQVQIRDMVYTLMPISNTITAVVMWITLPPYAEDTAALNKFFNIKNTNNDTPTQQ